MVHNFKNDLKKRGHPLKGTCQEKKSIEVGPSQVIGLMSLF